MDCVSTISFNPLANLMRVAYFNKYRNGGLGILINLSNITLASDSIAGVLLQVCQSSEPYLLISHVLSQKEDKPEKQKWSSKASNFIMTITVIKKKIHLLSKPEIHFPVSTHSFIQQVFTCQAVFSALKIG